MGDLCLILSSFNRARNDLGRNVKLNIIIVDKCHKSRQLLIPPGIKLISVLKSVFERRNWSVMMSFYIFCLLVLTISAEISFGRKVRQAAALDDSQTEITMGNITTEIFNLTDYPTSTRKQQADETKNLLDIGNMKKCREIKVALMKLHLLQSLLNCASCAYGAITLPVTIFL